MEDFYIYRNRLPQWRMTGARYFIGWNLHASQSSLGPEERDLVMQTLLQFAGERYELDAWVVMDDHTHALLSVSQNWSLEKLLHSWKSFTANQLQRRFGRQGCIWQKDTFTRIVRNEKEWNEKRLYIMKNPFQRWPELTHYKWVWPNEP